MTVPQNDRYIRYAPGGATTVMAYDFQIFNQADILVKRLRAGVTTDLVITTNYTVSGVGVLGGGNITLVVGSTAGDIYAIYGINEYRAADYAQAGDFLAADVNADINKQMQVSQQVRRDVNTSIRLSPVDPSFSTADLTIPILANRLDKFLHFNDVTGNLEVTDGTVDVDGTVDQINVVGTTVSIAPNPIIPGTTRMKIPMGTTGQRPGAPSEGDFRHNSTTSDFEAYLGGLWKSILNSGSGAPINSTYIVQTADGTLTNEQALSALTTGIMKSTTGTGVVSIDASLTSLSALATVADRIAYSTALNTWAETPLTAAGRALIDDATVGDQRTTLGLVIGTNVQAFDATLLSIAALGTVADRIAYTTGVDTWAETPLTAFGRSLIDDAAAVNARTTLGLVIGTDVQAFDATLLSIAALGTVADRIAYTTGVDTWAETPLTAAGRALIDDATAGDQRTTLGLGTMATQNANAVAITGGTFAGITQGDVDNLRLDGNTISSTDANGNIILDPNGTGQVAIASTAAVFDEIAAPGTPAAAKVILYAKADGHMYQKDDAGTETDLTISASAGALIYISQATAAASASLTFTGLTSAYSEYIFVLSNIRPATDDVYLWLRTSTDGGATYDAAAANYGHGGTTFYNFVTSTYTGNASDTKIALHGYQAANYGIDNGTDSGVSGTVSLVNPSAVRYGRVFFNVSHYANTGTGMWHTGHGWRLAAADIDAVQFLMSSGNITSGTIYVYGVKNT